MPIGIVVKRCCLVLLIALVVAPLAGPPARGQEQALLVVLIGDGVVGVAALTSLATRQCCARAVVNSEVRVVTHTAGVSHEIDGVLSGADADSLTIAHDGVVDRVPRRSIRQFDVKMGTERKWAQGWVIGTLAGGVVGATGGFASGSDDPRGAWFAFSAGEKAAIFGTVGSVLGGITGTLIGATINRSRWLRNEAPATSLIVGAAPHNSTAIELRVQF